MPYLLMPVFPCEGELICQDRHTERICKLCTGPVLCFVVVKGRPVLPVPLKLSWIHWHCNTWWRHQMETFSALLNLCAVNSPSPSNSPHKGQWRGDLMFSLICAWIKGWANNREAGDLGCHRAHDDVIVMNHILLPHAMPVNQACRIWVNKPHELCEN